MYLTDDIITYTNSNKSRVDIIQQWTSLKASATETRNGTQWNVTARNDTSPHAALSGASETSSEEQLTQSRAEPEVTGQLQRGPVWEMAARSLRKADYQTHALGKNTGGPRHDPEKMEAVMSEIFL